MSTNHTLGLQVHQLLQQHNLENCINWQVVDSWQDEKYLDCLTSKMADFMQTLGLDLLNNSLSDTPKRVVWLFLRDLFWGLDYRNFPDIVIDDNTCTYTYPIISKNIPLHSTCEHHFVAINGHVTIAYIQPKKIIGLGKLNQVVDFFAHRPQVQERLTRQIAIVLQYLLDTQDVAVAINATHDCIRSIGAKIDNEVSSFDLSGKFLSDKVLNTNFYNLALTKSTI